MLLGSRGVDQHTGSGNKKKKHNSRQWGRTDHCWGTVIARNLEIVRQTLEALLEDTKALNRLFYKKACF